MKQSKILHKYQNGNYTIIIFTDGTKIRYTKEETFKPNFPESIDLKITNNCDLLCPMCHENSNKNGKHATLNNPFLETLKKGTELAIGGGNPLTHPNLKQFLEKLKYNGIIANITINQEHLKKYQKELEELTNQNLIKGLGISVIKEISIEEILKIKQINNNMVIHIIAGVTPYNIIQQLFDKNIKLLVLGYKTVGRGKTFYNEEIENNISFLEKNILSLSNHFSLIAFDNLAIKQLKMENKIKNFSDNYMGNDGEFTMYIDLVEGTYAKSSTSNIKFKLEDNIEKMFKKIRSQE